MSTLADRLRGIVREITTRAPGSPVAPPAAEAPPGAASDREACAAEVLGGRLHETDGSRVIVVERRYPAGHRHGALSLMDHVLSEDAEWRRVLLDAPTGGHHGAPSLERRTLFIDLETTGIAGGAGTYAFLVGCGWFEACSFRIQQLFMTSIATERAVLAALRDLAASAHVVVSYNGKTFDLPLIETRYLFNRLEPPFAGMPHLDMLHTARRLWRVAGNDERAADCRLSTLEQIVCQHTREGDVPGFEIPSRYFHYVRTGDARPLDAVFEHNRLDLLSLAFLTARAAQMVEDGPPAVTTAREALGLGRLYERAGMDVRARACLARAAGMDDACPLPGDAITRAEGLRAYALACRRARHYGTAATAWARLAELPGCPPLLLREAAEALAVHHEHRVRDIGAARQFALRSLPFQTSPSRKGALQHRLARLDRKLDEAARRPAALF